MSSPRILGFCLAPAVLGCGVMTLLFLDQRGDEPRVHSLPIEQERVAVKTTAEQARGGALQGGMGVSGVTLPRPLVQNAEDFRVNVRDTGQALNPDNPDSWLTADNIRDTGDYIDPDDPVSWSKLNSVPRDTGPRLDPDDPLSWPKSIKGGHVRDTGKPLDPDAPGTWRSLAEPRDSGPPLDPDALFPGLWAR